MIVEMATKTKKKTVKPSVGRSPSRVSEQYDGVFALKLALYLVLGTLWIKVNDGSGFTLPIPVGLIIGLIFTAHEHFKIDRKIEYAVLLVAMLIGFWAPFGIYITL